MCERNVRQESGHFVRYAVFISVLRKTQKECNTEISEEIVCFWMTDDGIPCGCGQERDTGVPSDVGEPDTLSISYKKQLP